MLGVVEWNFTLKSDQSRELLCDSNKSPNELCPISSLILSSPEVYVNSLRFRSPEELDSKADSKFSSDSAPRLGLPSFFS